MDKNKMTLKRAFEIERELSAVAFGVLHRHENALRSTQRLPAMGEDAFAAELLKRWEMHA